MSKTKIEWCDYTINPIVGCTKCSPGCDNCYAERFATRLAKNPKVSPMYSSVVADGKWTGVLCVDCSCFNRLPKKPSRIFVCSMGDAFHEKVWEIVILDLFNRMDQFPHHTFMLLTKRPKRMRGMLSYIKERFDYVSDMEHPNVWPRPNVWLGVTVCNQQEADEKIPLLLSTPAAKRFVSVEPMLGPVDLTYLDAAEGTSDWCQINALTGKHTDMGRPCASVPRLDWVICGGETGPGARPMNPDWARSLRDQCRAAGVPFFFKKMSVKKPIPDDLLVREIPE